VSNFGYLRNSNLLTFDFGSVGPRREKNHREEQQKCFSPRVILLGLTIAYKEGEIQPNFNAGPWNKSHDPGKRKRERGPTMGRKNDNRRDGWSARATKLNRLHPKHVAINFHPQHKNTKHDKRQ